MFGHGVGCRRCSTCSIHYPPSSKYEVCGVCDTPTSFFSNVQPDPEWEDAVKYAKMHPGIVDRADPHTYRFERYLRMGFNEYQAQELACAVFGNPPFALYHVTVQRALDAGCDHHLAFDMFS